MAKLLIPFVEGKGFMLGKNNAVLLIETSIDQ